MDSFAKIGDAAYRSLSGGALLINPYPFFAYFPPLLHAPTPRLLQHRITEVGNCQENCPNLNATSEILMYDSSLAAHFIGFIHEMLLIITCYLHNPTTATPFRNFSPMLQVPLRIPPHSPITPMHIQ